MILAESYSELCEEIKTLEVRIEELERERKLLKKRMYDNAPGANLTIDYSKERVTGGQVPMTLDVVIERLNKLDDRIDQLYSFLEIKKDARNKIDKILKSSEDIDQKVVVMRDIKKMPLRLIAKELGYSYQHIRRISCRNKKMIS
ncbi:hypothetical protein [Alkalihalobacterium alkalinitrilicum]|uniref:hypothetical protein n=1 Tax=Alkalihalobacterium alkalinitrilicum TaxID=427920 RepID=UPI000994BE01|nr:hypothetical protein [Alkalihalobacterium alkalinitrilicum]